MNENTTLTVEQEKLLRWCISRKVFVDFTNTTLAVTYMRMSGKHRIGEIEYNLHKSCWYPSARQADEVKI